MCRLYSKGVVFIPLVTVIIIAILAGSAGVWLGSTPGVARRLIPFGGGVLLGVAVVWVLPEIAEHVGWLVAMASIVGGVAVLAAIDRWVYPVCPACSPEHQHHSCSTRLHGFAGPLFVAAALHSALDGWSLSAASTEGGLGWGFLAGIAVHKIPEGLALGVIARAALPTLSRALLWCVGSQGAMLVGGILENSLAPYLGPVGLQILLAVAGGSFLYLGWHAVDGEWRRSGPKPALVPALAGVAGSGVLKLFLK
jgi:zinc transporter ZupT